jgi:3',5'-cyclic AMP phosphodiesterase CpdA
MGDLFALWPLPPGRPAWAHWYSFDVADLHLVMLDSNAYDQPAQLEWLARDLAAARKNGARWIFAAVHDGAYSRGSHGGNKIAAQSYAPLLARHGVAVLFSGHDHIYQRGEVRGLRYVVSGGGGAPLYPISCGVSGRPACRVDDGMIKATSEHHYVALTVHRDHALMCARRPDRSPLEPCVRIPRPRR